MPHASHKCHTGVAVRSIFTAKGRPLTDPLIVHVSSIARALELIDVNNDEKKVFVSLGRLFWPGPLTIIVKSAKCVPSCITAETGVCVCVCIFVCVCMCVCVCVCSKCSDFSKTLFVDYYLCFVWYLILLLSLLLLNSNFLFEVKLYPSSFCHLFALFKCISFLIYKHQHISDERICWCSNSISSLISGFD